MRFLLPLFFLFIGLSPKQSLLAQTSTPNADAVQTLKSAEEAFERGRPNFNDARKALELANATDDLRLQARANLLQARLDSSGRRYSRALPYYNRATALNRQAAKAEAAAALAEAEAKAKKAVAARTEAESAKAAADESLVEERSAARWKYMTVIGICLAILAAGALGFLATVRKLNSDIKKAQKGQQESDASFAKARTQLSTSSRASMRRLRRILKAVSNRIPPGTPASAPNQVAAQESALGYLNQSSFEQSGSHEVAMEAFFDKFNPDLKRLLDPSGKAQLDTRSMPLRLPLDQAVPVALIYTELVGNALKHGTAGSEVKSSLSKEGNGVTLVVTDPSISSVETVPAGEGRKLVAYLVDEIGGRIDYPEGDGSQVRVRFTSVPTRGGAAPII